MKTKSYAITIAAIVSAVVFMAHFILWQFILGDTIYDSVFETSASELPVLKAGRIMPLSSASADILKTVSGKSSVKLDGQKISATKWLLTANATPQKLAKKNFFRADNKDLLKMLDAKGRYFPFAKLEEKYDDVLKSAQGEKSPLTNACSDILTRASVYSMATHAVALKVSDEENADDFISGWRKSVAEAAKELDSAKAQKRNPDESKLKDASDYLTHIKNTADYENSYSNAVIRAIPLQASFKTAAESLLERVPSQSDAAITSAYAKLCDSVKNDNKAAVYQNLRLINTLLENSKNINFTKLKIENIFNSIDPFLGGFILYALSCAAFFIGLVFIRTAPVSFASGTVFLLSGVAAHAVGILARMYIQGRPPVTNLYSSIVFAGMVAAAIGAFIYIRRRSVVFSVAAAASGLISLLVAMNLPHEGDTMGMMRAVLNSNFWLTLHVVTIMLGYCGVFLAGFVATFRLIANIVERKSIAHRTAEAAGGIYAILCFALFMSFAGTMLGGVWADMSWGRFWGWDPKENGALMIVLWCAAAIHGKVMRLLDDRAFLAMAIFGNIIAAWAWFGVNLMGVGLHAYGFIEGGWGWFFAFVAIQLAIMPLALFKRRE